MNPRLPAPGEGPFVNFTDIPKDTVLLGMAPIGVPWHADMKKGKVVPAGNCPVGEFALTHAMVKGKWHEVNDGYSHTIAAR